MWLTMVRFNAVSALMVVLFLMGIISYMYHVHIASSPLTLSTFRYATSSDGEVREAQSRLDEPVYYKALSASDIDLSPTTIIWEPETAVTAMIPKPNTSTELTTSQPGTNIFSTTESTPITPSNPTTPTPTTRTNPTTPTPATPTPTTPSIPTKLTTIKTKVTIIEQPKTFTNSSGVNSLTAPKNTENAAVSFIPRTCTRLKHFVFTKIEKTGSSTLFTLFYRFVVKEKLNLLVQTAGYHIGWDRPGQWMIGPRHEEPAEVLINHARYNESIIKTCFVNDTLLIIPFREPVSWINSAVDFFQLPPPYNNTKLDADTVILNDTLMEMPRNDVLGIKTWYLIPQLQWLGYKLEDRLDLVKMENFIQQMVNKIDIPVLREQLDASVIVIRRRMCWDYMDLFYQSSVVSNHAHTDLSKEARARLLSAQVNLGEKLLYEAANKSWWSQPEVRQPDFWEEVDYFTNLNQKVSRVVCPQVKKMQNVESIVEASKWHPDLIIRLAFCEDLTAAKYQLMANLLSYAK